ncbi:MAG: glycosyltransferase family 4 protein [Desulfatibacillum sp.]|nr:glycosyltransferase family 4 protein [Desulfatibacillum sp.]
MRIGINAIFLAPGKGGGMERYLSNMVRAMAEQVPRGSLVAFGSREGLPCLEGIAPVVASPVPASQRWARILWEQVVFPKVAREWKCDVMISFGNVCPVRLPCPSLVVMHDLIPYTPAHGFSPLEKMTAKFLFRMTALAADGVVTVSGFSKGQIVQILEIPGNKVSVIPGACDPVFFQQRQKKENGKPIILAGASALPHKNLEGLLRAYQIFANHERKNTPLVITHTHGTDKEIMDRAHQMGLGGRVTTTGRISDQELAFLYQRAAVFVCPSVYEGFGLPVLEAMASGAPVISSQAASLPEVAGGSALLVDPRNPAQIAGAMGLVLEDQDLRRKLSAMGTERAKEFSWEKSAAALLALARKTAGDDQ